MISNFFAASQSCLVPKSLDMVVSNPVSQQEKKKAGKRKVEKTAKQEKDCLSSGKRRKVSLDFEPQMQRVFLVLQPGAATNSTQISSRTVSQQTRNEAVTATPVQSEYLRNNTAELGGSPQHTLPTSMVQNIPLQRGHLGSQQPSSKQITGITVSQQTRSEVVTTTPVQSEYSRNNTAELRGSLQQTLPTSVVQNIPLQQGHLVSQQPSSKQISGITIAAQGSSQQYCLPAPVAMQKENCKPPLQSGQMEKQSCLSRSVLVASMQGSSQPCLPLQLCAVPGKQGQLELLINYCIEKLETLFKCQTM